MSVFTKPLTDPEVLAQLKAEGKTLLEVQTFRFYILDTLQGTTVDQIVDDWFVQSRGRSHAGREGCHVGGGGDLTTEVKVWTQEGRVIALKHAMLTHGESMRPTGWKKCEGLEEQLKACQERLLEVSRERNIALKERDERLIELERERGKRDERLIQVQRERDKARNELQDARLGSATAGPGFTPNGCLPPLVESNERRKIAITIDVAAGFENRLNNQWEVEREIHADRWVWKWVEAKYSVQAPPMPPIKSVSERIKESHEAEEELPMKSHEAEEELVPTKSHPGIMRAVREGCRRKAEGRKIIQVSSSADPNGLRWAIVTALCNDGTVWVSDGHTWQPLPPFHSHEKT